METFQKQSIGIVLKNECPGNFEKFAGKHLPRRFFKTSFWETCKHQKAQQPVYDALHIS